MSNEHHTPIATGADADAAVFNAPLAELDEAIVETKEDVTSLDGRLTTAEGEIDTLQSNVTNLQGRMTTAEGEIDTLQSNVVSLDGRLDTAEPEIDTLQSQMSTANSNISNLQGRMTTAESDIDALQASSGWGGVSGELLIDDEIEVGGNTENVWVVTGVNWPTLRVISSTGAGSRAIALINRTNDTWTIDPTLGGSNIRTPNNGYAPKLNEVLFLVRDGRVGQGSWHLVADVRVGNFEDLNFLAASVIEALNALYNMAVAGGATGELVANTTLTIDPNQPMNLVTGTAQIEGLTGGAGYPHEIKLIKASGATWSIEPNVDNIVAPAALGSVYTPQEYEVVTLVWETNNEYYYLIPGR